ncbi:MAG: hypothetical protein ACD_5C00351G0005 [uncultured bacterium]|nr:MAG: hypothetical protein ACD_5C00351G0005 [uncultured bacterium]
MPPNKLLRTDKAARILLDIIHSRPECLRPKIPTEILRLIAKNAKFNPGEIRKIELDFKDYLIEITQHERIVTLQYREIEQFTVDKSKREVEVVSMAAIAILSIRQSINQKSLLQVLDEIC